MADVLGVLNVSLTQIEPGHMVFDPALEADFVLVYGLLYHLEDPVRLLRLASQLTRKHILIETEVAGRIEDGHFRNQRDMDGMFSLSPDYSDHTVGGSANLALVPSVNALTLIMRTLGFADIKILAFESDDYEPFRGKSRVMVYGAKSPPNT
jgi:tRNA (mo5U34)-methyltransferase